MSEQALRTKVLKLRERNDKLRNKNKIANESLRTEKSRRKEIEASRSKWRALSKSLKASIKAGEIGRSPVCHGSEKIRGHQFGTLMVFLCVNAYLIGNCGFRSSIKLVSCLALVMGLELGRIPSKSSVENWVKKIGYNIYARREAKYPDQPYGLIVDESMVIGQERLLVILGVGAAKDGATALRMSQTEVLYMGVRPSWTGEAVCKEIQKVMEKEGKKASYAISDKGSTMCKGIFDAGLVRLADVGHEIARLTEKCYGLDPLEKFLAAAKQCKAKLIMTPMSYLLCPKQRKIARFMNLGVAIRWGRALLCNFEKLSTEEQRSFGWIKDHQAIVLELSEVFDTTEKILKIIKNEGLSYKTIAMCLEISAQKQKGGSLTVVELLKNIDSHLEGEKQKLPDGDTTWNASSDIIESLFGTYKSRKAVNPKHGVTSFILFLPLTTKIETDNNCLKTDIKGALEGVLMTDLEKWNKEQMVENQVFKRKIKFKN